MVIFFSILLITYLITNLFGYVIHWMLHQRWATQFNKTHMAHHKLYPAKNFTSDLYRDAGKDSSFKIFIVMAIPLILIPIILGLSNIISIYLVISILIIEGIMGFLHNYLHDAFHTNNHWLSKIPLIKNMFNTLVRLHYYHHANMNLNFGIFTFYWDKLLKTFKSK